MLKEELESAEELVSQAVDMVENVLMNEEDLTEGQIACLFSVSNTLREESIKLKIMSA